MAGFTGLEMITQGRLSSIPKPTTQLTAVHARDLRHTQRFFPAANFTLAVTQVDLYSSMTPPSRGRWANAVRPPNRRRTTAVLRATLDESVSFARRAWPLCTVRPS